MLNLSSEEFCLRVKERDRGMRHLYLMSKEIWPIDSWKNSSRLCSFSFNDFAAFKVLKVYYSISILIE